MIIDISQEVFSCRVYPGDPPPLRRRIGDMRAGDAYNLTAFSMCAHSGTHVDAPLHFLREGKDIEQMGLRPFAGPCWVARREGALTAAEAESILRSARASNAEARILIAGQAVVTAEAARVFAAAGTLLLGNESQTVGPEDAPMAVHRLLLTAGVALLEGVVLDRVAEGPYFLSAAPLKMAGSDGAPCRAYLIAWDDCPGLWRDDDEAGRHE